MSFRQNLLIKLSGMKLIFSTGLNLSILSDKGIEYTFEPDSKTANLTEIACLRGTLTKMCSNRLQTAEAIYFSTTGNEVYEYNIKDTVIKRFYYFTSSNNFRIIHDGIF